jgi:hypothetical protein
MTLELAKRMYLHRFTLEHVPAWALVPAPNGKYYAPQYRSDAEWFENTVFPPNNPLSKMDCCSSGQTWPMGQWLSAAYTGR